MFVRLIIVRLIIIRLTLHAPSIMLDYSQVVVRGKRSRYTFATSYVFLLFPILGGIQTYSVFMHMCYEKQPHWYETEIHI